ncbi:hypothetical protein BER2_3251 [plant metagenome]|uniref:Uncharacterized protein n=1 Tax=plant metagenome TaxID=1297885 RepID=A0A484QT59_9ZZZZ
MGLAIVEERASCRQPRMVLVLMHIGYEAPGRQARQFWTRLLALRVESCPVAGYDPSQAVGHAQACPLLAVFFRSCPCPCMP